MSTAGNALDLAEKFLQDARTARAGIEKAGTDPSKPTSHPVMKADDGTAPAREGSRSSAGKPIGGDRIGPFRGKQKIGGAEKIYGLLR